jgi:hypothetical protein
MAKCHIDERAGRRCVLAELPAGQANLSGEMATELSGNRGRVRIERRCTPSAREPLFLPCPRCGLSIRQRRQWLANERCPRCLARSRIPITLFASALPADELFGDDLTPARRGQAVIATPGHLNERSASHRRVMSDDAGAPAEMGRIYGVIADGKRIADA